MGPLFRKAGTICGNVSVVVGTSRRPNDERERWDLEGLFGVTYVKTKV